VSKWGLNRAFAKKAALLIIAINEARMHFTITSGYRSDAKQQQLIDQYLAGNKQVYTPAPVGKSLHGCTSWTGSPDSLAIDISTDNPPRAGQLAAKLDIWWAGMKDPVHFQEPGAKR